VETLDALEQQLDAVLPGLAARTSQLVLEVAVAQDATFDP
jgi:hypothetical protein